MNEEVYMEGWLIKSPPTKRIWRARWRKRWFTLKQGEIPGQFYLEYYTDRNCRKLKGVIDLDQCEQVDSGLRLEHRKQKFQYMFDIKTPRRTYYLAADTENDMRDWVNCICQVCNLHDFTKQPEERRYYNVDSFVASGTNNSNLQRQQQHEIINDNIATVSNNSDTLNNSTNVVSSDSVTKQATIFNCSNSNMTELTKCTKQLSVTNNTYQNNDFPYVNTDYSNRETMICESSLQKTEFLRKNVNSQQSVNLIDRSQSFKDIYESSNDTINTENTSETSNTLIPNHVRSQSLNENGKNSRTLISSTGVVKKIPENLVLSATAVDDSVEPSPALSTCSGPYIPISECFSGSPKILNNEVPSTPLNNLDPKFYDTPRIHNNIGLNLTDDQSYSPKIYNCPQNQIKSRSGRSTPSDSESVFTDDEEWSQSMPLRESANRNLRPSDSSVENESIIFTYTQRFSKIPDNTSQLTENNQMSTKNESNNKAVKRRQRLVLNSTSDEDKFPEVPQLSDTENASPAIGPRDASSCVEESYDIPRSHHLPYYNLSNLQQQLEDEVKQQLSPKLEDNPIATSTPDLIAETELAAAATFGKEKRLSSVSAKTLPRPHFYTNAAPTKVEGNVFRYDFIEQTDLPPVNRNLKPKLNPSENKTSTPDLSLRYSSVQSIVSVTSDKSPPRPPCVDRKLKPSTIKSNDSPIESSTLRRPGVPASFIASTASSEFNVNHKDLETRTLPRNVSTINANFSKLNNSFDANTSSSPSSSLATTISTNTLQKPNNSQLQYFDLDTSNPPPPPPINRATSSGSFSLTSNISKLGTSLDSGITRPPAQSSVVYNSVDFLKTEAFKRIREDAEKNRLKN